MQIEINTSLQPYNSFGFSVKAHYLARIYNETDVQELLNEAEFSALPKFVLGCGSNLVLTGDVRDTLVLKAENTGFELLEESAHHYLVQAQAGDKWHDFVSWTVSQGYAGLENMALIPGTVGAAPVQNIGAYGLELQDRFDSLDAIDFRTGQLFTLTAAQCGFGYRDSIFKHKPLHSGDMGLNGQAMILRVRFRLPKIWKPILEYADIERHALQQGFENLEQARKKMTPAEVFHWICAIRQGKLPDPKVLGNAGSFFKNPTVSQEQCQDIIAREPHLVHYKLHNGRYKLAAGWLIDACGWRGKTIGHAGVYDKQALVLVNHGGATGSQMMLLSRLIQTSVYERFGIMLEPEPVVL